MEQMYYIGHNTGWARGPNCRGLNQKQPNGIRDEVRNRVDPQIAAPER
jgi:hypothetical protein